ncbi:serine palmitoyltransferase component [Vanrija albida]|uniref:serine C-palmitoyltransferase n=1 Tax=Vanrija albida TaxID=181172 RepID=A0ABR3Q8K2_9TREE
MPRTRASKTKSSAPATPDSRPESPTSTASIASSNGSAGARLFRSAPKSPSKEAPPLTARSSLLDVLSRPRAAGAALTYDLNPHVPEGEEEEVSDQSTISSYASTSSTLSRSPSDDELARLYRNYLETPFVKIKSIFKHSEFGHDNNNNWRWTSQYNPAEPVTLEEEPDAPYVVLLTTYLSYLLLIVLGHIRDFFGKRFYPSHYSHLLPHNGYAALHSDFDSFYTRRLKSRLDDCFSRPVTGVPGRTIMLLDRYSNDAYETFHLSGKVTRALNVSSYNYLGFASSSGGCADAVEEGIRRYGIAGAATRHDSGSLDLHIQAEKLVAEFVGSEDSMIVSMGFATNSTTIPALVDKGCLVISDEFNHASIRFGVRLSGASVRTFKHNDMAALEELLRDVVAHGQPRTHRPWKKILVMVEGLYSMEGTLVNLPVLLDLKQRYKFYLYVDEAHSVGAMGPNGRGVCDYFGIDPREVDILMGTFTKSFGAAGGYIAGNKDIIDSLRVKSHAFAYAEAMSPPILVQIIASMSAIMGVAPPLNPPLDREAFDHEDESALSVWSRNVSFGPTPREALPTWMSLPPAMANGTEGREKLRRLAFNSRYLSSGLRKLGFIVYGHRDSPIIPLLLFNPGKMGMFSRMMLNRVGPDKTPIAVVIVAYPATPLITSRVRFCLSASHTKNDIDLLLRAVDEVGEILGLKYTHERWSVDRVIASAEELVAAHNLDDVQ